ncbi:MAG: hypothetical protein GY799_25205 [Desulfobulbaceae bacterium]|nr:hypothetical protein [Desulfobulbaceae bacterium]
MHADYYSDPTDGEDDDVIPEELFYSWTPPDEYKTSAKGADMAVFRAECEKSWPGAKMVEIDEGDF